MKLSERMKATPFADTPSDVVKAWADEAAQLESERDCLLLAIKHYDLADMLDKDVAKTLDMCAKGIVPPYARGALPAKDE